MAKNILHRAPRAKLIFAALKDSKICKKNEDAFLFLFQDPLPKRHRLQYDRAN